MQTSSRKLNRRFTAKFPLIAGAALLGVSIAALKGDPTTAPATQPITAPAPTAPVAANVDALIKQLGSDNADDRDAAQKQLVDMGEKVIPALKKAAEENEDPEIQSRAAAALALMKDKDSNGVSLITLHMKDAPVQDVLDAIGKQSHCTFLPSQGTNSPTLSLDADSKPYWDVVTDVCTQLNVCPMVDLPNKNAVRLFATTRSWVASSPHQIVGPYWISIAGLYRTRSIDLQGAPQIDDQFSVRLMVIPEPKLIVTQMSGFTVKEAADELGHSLMPRPQAAGIASIIRSSRQMNHTIETRLSYPEENAGKKIAILRGEVTAMLAQDVQQFTVDDVLGTPKTTNPLTGCKITATVAKQGAAASEMYRVTVTCSREGLSEDQWNAMTNHLNDLSLEDADGHALTGFPSGISMSNAGANDSTFTATSIFTRTGLGGMIALGGIGAVGAPRQVIKTGEPKRLTWSIATSVKPVAIPVTFNDLPMP